MTAEALTLFNLEPDAGAPSVTSSRRRRRTAKARPRPTPPYPDAPCDGPVTASSEAVAPDREPAPAAGPVVRLLLKPTQAARALGIGRSKLYELIAAGTLDSVQIGSARRIPADALASYVESLRNPPLSRWPDNDA